MTNFEKIKQMSVEDFANWAQKIAERCFDKGYALSDCGDCPFSDLYDCDVWGIEEWLKSDVEMTNLEIAKSIVNQYFSDADCGIFCTRNLVGDTMENIYNNNGLIIDICYECEYFEVFGLNPREFKELKDYYDLLCKESEK